MKLSDYMPVCKKNMRAKKKDLTVITTVKVSTCACCQEQRVTYQFDLCKKCLLDRFVEFNCYSTINKIRKLSSIMETAYKNLQERKKPGYVYKGYEV